MLAGIVALGVIWKPRLAAKFTILISQKPRRINKSLDVDKARWVKVKT